MPVYLEIPFRLAIKKQAQLFLLCLLVPVLVEYPLFKP
jgi:hypothetical protein